MCGWTKCLPEDSSSQVCEGIAADTRIRSKFLVPGIGYGGSCFPKDVLAFRSVANAIGYGFELLSAVMAVNEEQRERFVEKVRAALWTLRGKRLNGARNSPVIRLVEHHFGHQCCLQSLRRVWIQAISNGRWRRILRSSFGARSYFFTAVACAILWIFVASRLAAQDAHFHNAPKSSVQQLNPYAGQTAAVAAGARLYATDCASCHGMNGQGSGNGPPLSEGPTQSAPDGEVFWFITTGSVNNGMPAWGSLTEQQRWQIVTYLKSLKNFGSGQKSASASRKVTPVKTNAPPPQPPYTDFRFEEPGRIRKITVQDLPGPYGTDTANNGPRLVARPDDAWPKAPSMKVTPVRSTTQLRSRRAVSVFIQVDFSSESHG
jgi:mono/diheme cytochrome c family protein